MYTGHGNSITSILQALRCGEHDARARLFDLVYHELRKMARNRLRAESHNQTLDTTELVHEAYIRLCKDASARWENRRHFFGAAAQAMRQILVDRARKRKAIRHGGRSQRLPLNRDLADDENPIDLIALDQALTRLASDRPRHAEVVKYRYFLGLTVDETAELLQVSPRTVDLDWQLARSWLRREINGPTPLP